MERTAMQSYDALDHVADSINPLFGVVALALPWLRRPTQARRALLMNALTLAAVALAYCGQLLDAHFQLWPRFGLDYSTHTAVFTAIASSLWQHGRAWQYSIASVGAGYAALMLWQRYHSVMDIVTTAGVMLVVLVFFWAVVMYPLSRSGAQLADIKR
jgi:hypothetical protein